MYLPGGGGVCNPSGRRKNPFFSGMTRCAMASMGRCLQMGREGTSVLLSGGRSTEERPMVGCQKES